MNQAQNITALLHALSRENEAARDLQLVFSPENLMRHTRAIDRSLVASNRVSPLYMKITYISTHPRFV